MHTLALTLARAAGILLLASACTTVGRDHESPAAVLPDAWHESARAGLSSDAADVEDWWTLLGDPLLDDLVDRAVAKNHDLRQAFARVQEARALRGVAASEHSPTLDGLLGYERRGESENTPLGGFVPDSDLYSLGFDASWELDVWGRIRRSVEAADAEFAASLEDVRDVALMVAGEVAVEYVDLRAFQRRLEIARANLSLQEQTLVVVRGRVDAGLAGPADVAQARANVETTRARLPSLERGRRGAENRLAVLLGQTPGSLAAELGASGPIPVPPARMGVGVPADVLRRRADVRRAERLLAAETARIGVAEGDLYPRLALSGSVGLASDSSGNLLERDSNVFAFGPSLRWNLFDGGRTRNRVAAQEARAEAALLRWEQTVLSALEEVENAMTAFVHEQERRDALHEAVLESRRAVEFAQSRYVEGLSDFQAVLDPQRTLAQLEDEVALSEAAITTSMVALGKALGGGFVNGAASPGGSLADADAAAGSDADAADAAAAGRYDVDGAPRDP